jgi:hypothetical protein
MSLKGAYVTSCVTAALNAKVRLGLVSQRPSL